MKNFTNLMRPIAAAAVLTASAINVMAQGDAAQLIKAGTADINTLFSGYMGPLMKSFGAGLNGGWYQTAKPHGIGGFDLTVSFNAAFAPTADQSYDITKFNALKVSSKNPGETTAPSIFGKSGNGPEMDVMAKNPAYTQFASAFPGVPNPNSQDTAVTSFALPPGLGVNLFPVPTAQFSVGVGFGTEIGIRFIPNISTGDLSTGLWGFAVKHDFKQWIPGMKELPFDLSAMFGYTSFNLENKFTKENSIKPESGSDVQPDNSGRLYDNQKITMESNAWTANVIISKKLGPFTPYLGVGYQSSNTTLNLEGNYPITIINENYNPAALPGSPNSYIKKTDALADPISIDGSLNSFRANAGFRLKLLVLTIHGDYTFGKYNVASVGLGINLQSIAPFKL
jgi:opacity protein-like surface antigen